MTEFVHFLRRQAFGIAILACAAVAFAFPSAFAEWGGVKLTSLVVPAIQLIMFGMGTTLSPDDFLRVAKRPWAVATGVVLQFLVMPIVGFTLAKSFGFSGELAAGCVLVGSVAGGTASNVIAFLAKADVALSVTMTCCSTLLSPFVTPLAMKVLAGRFVAIDAASMMVEILKVVVVPIAAGALVLQNTKVGPHELWGGVPAKMLKMAKPGMAEAYAEHYVGYAHEYLEADAAQ